MQISITVSVEDTSPIAEKLLQIINECGVHPVAEQESRAQELRNQSPIRPLWKKILMSSGTNGRCGLKRLVLKCLYESPYPLHWKDLIPTMEDECYSIDGGSSTIGWLKNFGLVREASEHKYTLTEEGKALWEWMLPQLQGYRVFSTKEKVHAQTGTD